MNRKILFIGGTLNQTSMMHEISKFFPLDDCFFTQLYADGYLRKLAEHDVLDWTILGNKYKIRNYEYCSTHRLKIDVRGEKHQYDLVFTCTDLIIPKNIRNKRLILVQEGMTDPEDLVYFIVKHFNLPRWIASTSTTGISNLYDKFCVASEGYRDLFIKKGADPNKIVITGIPNFDNSKKYLNNDFPHRNYVLVCTSDARETLKTENRIKFIKECVQQAKGKQLIFKLHPNENFKRGIAEIKSVIPEALIYTSGNTEHMIANCDVLITKYSSTVYVGMALGKEVHSYFKLEDLKKLTPIQNGGASAGIIAEIGHELLKKDVKELKSKKSSRIYSKVAQFLS